MNPEVKVIMYEEKKVLQQLLDLLDKQYECILAKDIFEIDKIAKEIDKVSKVLANLELKRRSFVGGDVSFKELVENCNDENIKTNYELIKHLLKMLEVQKETNSLLIKQQLFFTKKMINLIKPSKNNGTYNSYGNVTK
ncbi:MAG: flagellar export chaperone FlgN [Peptostreptococcaceae bacterium]